MGSKSSKAPEAPAKEPDDHKTLRLSYEVKELSQQTKPAHRSKIVLKGPEQSGKTSLGMRCCNNEFDPQYAATIGVDFRIARFSLNEVEHTLQIWDTSGQDRFRAIGRSYFRGDAYLICVRATASQEECREAVLKELNDRDFSNYPREESFLERVYGVVTACDEASAEQIALSVQTMQAVMREQNLQCQRVFITSSRSGRGVMDMFWCVARDLSPQFARLRLPWEGISAAQYAQHFAQTNARQLLGLPPQLLKLVAEYAGTDEREASEARGARYEPTTPELFLPKRGM